MDSSSVKTDCGCNPQQACPSCVSRGAVVIRTGKTVTILPGDVETLKPSGIPVSILRADLDEIEAFLNEPDTPQMAYFRRAAPCNTHELRLPTSDMPRPHSHYFKPCPFPSVDVYRVLKMFEVTDPCLQHAVKKLLCTGNRGHKSAEKDVQDAIDSLTRWQGMRKEELA